MIPQPTPKIPEAGATVAALEQRVAELRERLTWATMVLAGELDGPEDTWARGFVLAELDELEPDETTPVLPFRRTVTTAAAAQSWRTPRRAFG